MLFTHTLIRENDIESNSHMMQFLGKTVFLFGEPEKKWHRDFSMLWEIQGEKAVHIQREEFNFYKDLTFVPSLDKDTDTIMLDETFIYISQIIDLLLSLKENGIKFKRIVNLMDYGKEELCVLGKKLGFKTYKIGYDHFERGSDFKLFEVTYEERALEVLETKHGLGDIEEVA